MDFGAVETLGMEVVAMSEGVVVWLQCCSMPASLLLEMSFLNNSKAGRARPIIRHGIVEYDLA